MATDLPEVPETTGKVISLDGFKKKKGSDEEIKKVVKKAVDAEKLQPHAVFVNEIEGEIHIIPIKTLQLISYGIMNFSQIQSSDIIAQVIIEEWLEMKGIPDGKQ